MQVKLLVLYFTTNNKDDNIDGNDGDDNDCDNNDNFVSLLSMHF